MKKYTIITMFIVLLISGVSSIRLNTSEDSWMCADGQWVMHGKPKKNKPDFPCPTLTKKEETPMKLYSSAFGDNDFIPKMYSCDGVKKHPPLSMTNITSDTKSLAIILDDPDAPGGTFIHWVMWNIPADTKEIAEDMLPNKAIEGINSKNTSGYYPPCPPVSTHRYIFTLFALDTILDIPASANVSQLRDAMKSHIVTQTQLTGLYKR